MTDFPTKRSLWASNIYCFKNEAHLSLESQHLIHVYDLKSRSKVKRLINRFPKLKKRLVKTFKSRPVYEKQETFAEDKINDYLIMLFK